MEKRTQFELSTASLPFLQLHKGFAINNQVKFLSFVTLKSLFFLAENGPESRWRGDAGRIPRLLHQRRCHFPFHVCVRLLHLTYDPDSIGHLMTFPP